MSDLSGLSLYLDVDVYLTLGIGFGQNGLVGDDIPNIEASTREVHDIALLG
ncbi:MAG: hypothetical protein V2I46_09930 [Bacteroides sp.]|nr:hypothetical protein [Bacteroides sp.]